MSIGAAVPAMLRAEGVSPNSGKEESPKSGSSRVLSTLSLAVGLSIGLLNHGKRRSLSLSGLFAVFESQSTGVVGVESREGNRD
jgi:hypothetical protein